MHGRQTFAYTVIKHLNKSEEDAVRINVTEEKKWIEHYKELWFQRKKRNATEVQKRNAIGVQNRKHDKE